MYSTNCKIHKTIHFGGKVLNRLFLLLYPLKLFIFFVQTGELTGQIVQANTPKVEDMAGKKVGVMHYRDYEAFVVAQNGGKVYRSESLYRGELDFTELVKMMINDSIDGIAIEYEAFFHIESTLDNEELTSFLLTKTTTTEKTYIGENLSYGILVQDKDVYNYFKEYVAEALVRNQYYFSTENNEQKEEYGKKNKKLFGQGNSILFSSESEYFVRTMTAIGIMLGVIVIFGVLFELQRKKKFCKQCGQINIESEE